MKEANACHCQRRVDPFFVKRLTCRTSRRKGMSSEHWYSVANRDQVCRRLMTRQSVSDLTPSLSNLTIQALSFFQPSSEAYSIE